ncbi:MAG TPA: type II toxin-antitoxin system RelB/DinJ family antitoxin [Candidatus Pullilachnospira intestinigallinarum]|nr:type II toxin-antitoxin system RelB/DinJ family antitoxin [Candidatus Pullilachnospira intestinigallinarum]
MVTVSLRLEDNVKKELDEICDKMGMNITTFYMIYTKKVLRDRKIPFEITAPRDPFYSEENQKQLSHAYHEIKEGRTVEKTLKELEGMEYE